MGNLFQKPPKNVLSPILTFCKFLHHSERRPSEFRDLSEKALNFVPTAITIEMRVERLYERTPLF